MAPIRVTFNLCFPYKFTHRKKWVVASCNILDVHSQGETEKKALDNLKEALQLFITSCFERGTLDKVLRDCGFVASKRSFASKKKTGKCIDVPLQLMNYSSSNKPLSECHV